MNEVFLALGIIAACAIAELFIREVVESIKSMWRKP